MKKLIFIVPLLALILTSCIKDSEVKFEGKSFVEFDANTFNAPTSPYPYNVVTRVVPFGYASATSYPLVSRTTGSVKLRVNLVGRKFSTDQQIMYTILSTPAPVSPNALAVSGTHFTTNSMLTIPANSNFGELTVNILNTGTTSTTLREVHLQLVGNSEVSASGGSSNAVALRISQL
jgi:hypothetical protein